MFGNVFKCFLALLFIISGVTSCATLKPVPLQPVVTALPPAKSGVLSKVALQIKMRHGQDKSGFLLLADNKKALNWRLALVDHAVKSIDAQYFIWQNDATGNLLFDRLIKAADRGVRVRLLVDDFVLNANDRDLALLSSHPYFKIKIYNPQYTRENTLGQIGEFFFYFKELNRRMHNKLFIVDGQVAIMGGRNIGNPYFGLSETYNFRDLDVMVAGAVLPEISNSFDEYWNSDLAYPTSSMTMPGNSETFEKISNSITVYLDKNRFLLHQYSLEPKNWEEQLQHLVALMKPGVAHIVQDTPANSHGKEVRLIDMLDHLAEPVRKEVIIVSPYLIPGRNYLREVGKLVSEGVKVSIITNSLGSNNHTMAHSHYKKYRREILNMGAELFEFKHNPSMDLLRISDVPPVSGEFISLHMKAMVGDRKTCFIGSLNLDHRAMKINTENGLYIESEPLAAELAQAFDQIMKPENSWNVSLDGNDTLSWSSSTGKVFSQPARTFSQRISDFFLRLLPIESQL